MSEQMTPQEAAERIFSITDYVHHSDWFDVEDEKALDMAWEALLDAVPHVLTLDEARVLEPHTAIYAEIKGDTAISQCGMLMVMLSTNPEEVIKLTKGWKRYWTQYPSRELRAATPWLDDDSGK